MHLISSAWCTSFVPGLLSSRSVSPRYLPYAKSVADCVVASPSWSPLQWMANNCKNSEGSFKRASPNWSRVPVLQQSVGLSKCTAPDFIGPIQALRLQFLHPKCGLALMPGRSRCDMM